jgi:hypothetical protein
MTVHATRGLIHLHHPDDGPPVPAVFLPDTPEWNLAGRHVTVIRDPEFPPLNLLGQLAAHRARPWLGTTWRGTADLYLRSRPHRQQDIDLAALILGRSTG